MTQAFQHDKKDRKRRFLRGLNALLNLDNANLENKYLSLKDTLKTNISKFRNNLANIYGLEFTNQELTEIIKSDLTTGEFTEKYCAKIYQARGRTTLNNLITDSIKQTKKGPAIDLREIDKSLKYGLNGSQWCDVAEGPCSCGAWHH